MTKIIIFSNHIQLNNQYLCRQFITKNSYYMRKITLIIAIILSLFLNQSVFSCTNFLITKGASADGSCMITYAADSHNLYGELYFRAAMDYAAGSLYKVYEWDTGKYLGEIKQVGHTYSVVGNMNEYQVSIGETTFGGLDALQTQKGAIVDYGSLIYLALQRSKTAREAIKVMTELVTEYGYYSSGESFSIADPNEVWILEMISKGDPYKVTDKKGKVTEVNTKGAVWVAVRIPDGYISGHANHPRITKFPLEDKKTIKTTTTISFKNIARIFEPQVEFVYADDVISFARDKGFFNGKDEEFSFSDTYAPLWDATGKLIDYGGIRFCEARVWSGFRRVNKEMDKYESYILGKTKERMPLYIKPTNKLTVKDVMELMRDHYEGTPLDMTNDVGAGPYKVPYRWRPMTWNYVVGKDTVNYLHERAISTQQTGFSFVTQSRSWLPNAIGGINWFGVDDAYSTVYVPMYYGITKVPDTFKEGNGSMIDFTWNSAHWVFNWVSNFTYSRYSEMIVDVRKVQTELEGKFIENTKQIDQKAADLYKTDAKAGIAYLTEYSCAQGDMVTKRWEKLGQYLLVKYMDGNVKKEKDGKFQLNGTEHPLLISPNHPAYPQDWYKRIVDETKDRYKMIK